MLKKPNQIYDFILNNINNIENKLEAHSFDKELNSFKQKTLKEIQKFKDENIIKNIKELKKDQEWNTFTIAFYGETNAGKSTIIECLRIYLQEQTKMKEQKNFQKTYNKFNSKQKQINLKISNSESNIIKEGCNHTSLLNDFKMNKQDIANQISNTYKIHLEKKEKSIWYRLISFFKLDSLEKDIFKLSISLDKENGLVQNELNILRRIEENKNIEEIKIKKFKKNLTNLQKSNIKKLGDLSDGKIIGDGRSDFTRKTTKFILKRNNQKFSFLDIPGIEGKEMGVIEEITSAIKKAHIVFYITGTTNPPQKGSNTQKGTLEKIKEHLNSQTEVYSLFNKRITNPMQLTKPLISNEEIDNLKVLSEKMKEVLGSNYIGNKNMSAKVSFLSLAEYLIPNSDILKEKNNFLKDLDKNSLLEKSLFIDFVKFLTDDVIKKAKPKIKKSNLNKANNEVKKMATLLVDISENNFKPLYKQLSKEVKYTSDSLDNTSEVKIDTIKSEIKKITRKFKEKSRKEIYNYIDTDVSDDKFKSQLKCILERDINTAISDVETSTKKETEEFENDINEVIEKFKRRASMTSQEFNSIDLNINGVKFKLDLDMDNGIDGWALTGSIFGGSAAIVGNMRNPIRWAMLAVSISGVVKAVWNSFSIDYKKAEQKKYANANIDVIATKARIEILERLESRFTEFTDRTYTIKTNLELTLKQIKQTDEFIINSKIELEKLSKKIQIEGEK